MRDPALTRTLATAATTTTSKVAIDSSVRSIDRVAKDLVMRMGEAPGSRGHRGHVGYGRHPGLWAPQGSSNTNSASIYSLNSENLHGSPVNTFSASCRVPLR